VNREAAEVTSAGRAFQTRAPATEKAQRPTVGSLTAGTHRSSEVEDRSLCWDGMSATEMLVLYKLSTNRNGTDTLAVSTESMLAHSKCTASSLALAVDNRTCRISHSHRRVYTMNSETANPTALSLSCLVCRLTATRNYKNYTSHKSLCYKVV